MKTYFEMWGRKLLLRPAAGDQVLFVDACAGRGMDDVGNHGSPVIAAKAALEAEAQLHDKFKLDVRVQVVAIEEKSSHFKALCENLRPFGDRARTLHGRFADHAASIAAEFAGVPTLWFIDPFGIEALDAVALRTALAGPKSEAFILFNDQGALRHFGVAIAEETQMERSLKDLDDQPTLFPELTAAERQRLQPKAEKSRESLRVTREKAIEILNSALERTDWQQAIAESPRHLRGTTIRRMFEEVLIDCGASYITTFPVISAEGDHVYYLIHATKNAKGRLTMKEAVEFGLKHGPLPHDTIQLLRGHLRCDLLKVEAFLLARLAGKRVRWAPDPEERKTLNVKSLVLEETEIHCGQLAELRARLERLRDHSERSVVYQFPLYPG